MSGRGPPIHRETHAASRKNVSFFFFWGSGRLGFSLGLCGFLLRPLPVQGQVRVGLRRALGRTGSPRRETRSGAGDVTVVARRRIP